MLQGVRSAVRTSWVSVTLAAALGVTMPLAATMAGTALAAPVPVPSVIVVPGGVHTDLVRRVTPLLTSTHGGRDRGTQPKPQPKPKPQPSPWASASILVHVPAGGMAAHRAPSAASPTVGTVVATSKYYGVPIVLRLDAINVAGTWGRVALPYVWPRRDGWIRL